LQLLVPLSHLLNVLPVHRKPQFYPLHLSFLAAALVLLVNLRLLQSLTLLALARIRIVATAVTTVQIAVTLVLRVILTAMILLKQTLLLFVLGLLSPNYRSLPSLLRLLTLSLIRVFYFIF
jgi:hypothetical protein